MNGSSLGPTGGRVSTASGASGRDVADETKTPSETRVGGAPRVIYRWPARGVPPAPPGDLAPVLHDVRRYIRRYVVLSDPVRSMGRCNMNLTRRFHGATTWPAPDAG